MSENQGPNRTTRKWGTKLQDRETLGQNFMIKMQDRKMWDWKMQDWNMYGTRDKCFVTSLKSVPKTAAPIEMPFGMRTWVGTGNHVLDGVQIPPWEGAKILGENGRPIVKYRDTLRSSVQRRLNR